MTSPVFSFGEFALGFPKQMSLDSIYNAEDSCAGSVTCIRNGDYTSNADRRQPLFMEDQTFIGLDYYYVPLHYQNTLQSILIPHGNIVDRVEKLAYDIHQDYVGETIHILCVLKGGSTFFQDLCNALRKFHTYSRRTYVPFTFDFIRVKSYEGTSSTGSVTISGCDVSKLTGKHVLFVEDIIDTGLTMTKLLEHMNLHVKPASTRVASLLEKRTERSCGYKADYVGFCIPDEFVVGYCLDYNEFYRDMNHIGIINPFGIEKYKANSI